MLPAPCDAAAGRSILAPGFYLCMSCRWSRSLDACKWKRSIPVALSRSFASHAFFHPLTGNRAGRYSVRLTANVRITFGWDGDGAVDVDIEDYH